MLDAAIKHWVNILKAAPTSSKWDQSKIDTVATETAIAELTSRANSTNVLPPAPKLGADIASLAMHISAHTQKQLLSGFVPLSERPGGYPKDLTTFWIEAETALKSLHPSMVDMGNPMLFGPLHVANVGPILLGVEAWL